VAGVAVQPIQLRPSPKLCWDTLSGNHFGCLSTPSLLDTSDSAASQSAPPAPRCLPACARRSGWTRVIVEKPFGRDSASSKELGRGLAKHLDEDQIYRIDHYLGTWVGV
jgi:hypothetical protein